MTFLPSRIPSSQRQVRSFALHLFLCMTFLLSVVSYANAVEPKPAQRVRHGGIKPFTTEQINDFLSERRNATIATLNKNGTPQLTPVIFYWDGSTFYASVTKETIKYKNLKRDPRISLVVDDVLGHHCVIATGKATIQEQDIWEMTEKIMYKYYGPEEGAPYIEQLKKQNRVLIVLKPTKIQAWGSVPRETGKP
jgi:PPOX class probable F420-dependent enzyme